MTMPGLPELLLISLIVVLIFGAKRLPQIGEGIGKGIRNLKKGLKENDDIDVSPADRRVADSSSAEELDVADAEVVDKKT